MNLDNKQIEFASLTISILVAITESDRGSQTNQMFAFGPDIDSLFSEQT